MDGWSSVVATAPVAVPIGCGRGFDRRGYPAPCPAPESLRPGEVCQNCTGHFLLTGVRYAWGEWPCCGGNLDTSAVPCPVNSCPISTYNSTLPAAPFTAELHYSNATATGTATCRCPLPQICS